MLKRVETQGRCVLCGPSALEGAAPELECRDCDGKHFVCFACVKQWDLGGYEMGKQFGAPVTVVVLEECPDAVLVARELMGEKPPPPNAELQDGLMGGARAAMAERERERGA